MARIWTYHARYDDVLVLIPMVALFRLAKQPAPARPDVAAGVMFALTLATMLVPARLLLPPWPWTPLVEAGQTVVWLGALAFLTGRGWPRPGAPPGAAG